MKTRQKPESQCGPERSGWRIAVMGTGGQGVLTAARLLCDVFVERGHDVVSSQLHGMSQRGGTVQSTVMIDAGKSPMLAPGTADLVIGFEPIETARGLPLISARTVVFMNTSPVLPYVLAQEAARNKGEAECPSVDELIRSLRTASPRVLPIDATQAAKEAGSIKTLNVVMLGCLLGSNLLPCSSSDFWSALVGGVPAGLAEVNQRAFEAGVVLAEKIRSIEMEMQL